MSNKPYIYWAEDVRDEIGSALLVAQNALSGYLALSNGPDTPQHHACAQHALDTVTEAIRRGRLYEQFGIELPNSSAG
jgi:hypothetical protein